MLSAPTVSTDATVSSEAELNEAAAAFLGAGPFVFGRTEGGVNNKVYYVTAPTGTKYVLRVYNNGFNRPRVAYEHAVLTLLAAKRFSFEVPTLLKTMDGSATSVTLSTGSDACMFTLIPGGPAKLSDAKVIGAATAELVNGMADLRIDLPLPNPLYRNIYEAHHKITRPLFFEVIAGSAFDDVRADTDYLLSELLRCETLVADIVKMEPSLPEQLCHADMHFNNVLTLDGKVTGLLDFEFCAPDWRIMELAVGLSKYVGMEGIEPVFEEWVDGYAACGTLTPEEARLGPDLIILRVLSNVVYFAGRAVAGEDDISALTTRVKMYADRCRWIHARKEWMQTVLASKLVPK